MVTLQMPARVASFQRYLCSGILWKWVSRQFFAIIYRFRVYTVGFCRCDTLIHHIPFIHIISGGIAPTGVSGVQNTKVVL